ncbi:alanine racemase [Tissierella praeacuta]|uniref:Alanine racemase n=1 Tax=Tissierella praeacuta DSM 18095 TaxID=1123404 RepID=A0A1M4V891_9FIRM|nr:alanine racemase [Tissierella praeacuta]SHE65206.1 alanine racemase [Tissierella praeacuta DSM 18095]SUP03021.1 Alanine racemase [Tissierella praeacuta]HAE92764.1 alanine racemase [Tissierella sp.]
MYTLEEIRPVWAEINLDNLAHNIREVRKHTDKDALVTAVVKANGYGHGSVEISRTFLDNGADRLAVALLTEAIELRKGNITEPILILGYTPPTQYEKLLEYNIIQTIYNYEDAKILSNKAVELGKKATIHIKIDSGMGRIGFLPIEDSIKDIINISKLPNIYVEGIFTHLAKADEIDKSHAMEQFEKYMKVVNNLEKHGLSIPLKHVSNSAGIIDIPKFNLNMVRAGIMIYGFYPSEEVEKNMKLKPAMALKAKISHLKVVPKGTGISYGQIFVTEKESKIATIPIGYADGFTRMLTGKAEVAVRGKRAKIVGKICMDQCMIDVTNIDDVKLGDEVVIFGYGLDCPSADELASKLGTINYEIVCMVGRRVPRVYMSGEKIVKIKDYLLE